MSFWSEPGVAGRSDRISMEKQYVVYITTNKDNRVLYTGVTGDLKRRIWEHKNKIVDGFSAKYNATKLVYYELYTDATEAIKREKQIKNLLRRKKIFLIEQMNPEWNDLYDEILR